MRPLPLASSAARGVPGPGAEAVLSALRAEHLLRASDVPRIVSPAGDAPPVVGPARGQLTMRL